jgi:hypothetical protein
MHLVEPSYSNPQERQDSPRIVRDAKRLINVIHVSHGGRLILTEKTYCHLASNVDLPRHRVDAVIDLLEEKRLATTKEVGGGCMVTLLQPTKKPAPKPITRNVLEIQPPRKASVLV